jgi:hypothetical protein
MTAAIAHTNPVVLFILSSVAWRGTPTLPPHGGDVSYRTTGANRVSSPRLGGIC